ncbi:23S rRNA (uracil(1939)-C(5))-methyltransferase RlmD [Opitutaceae bacterium]
MFSSSHVLKKKKKFNDHPFGYHEEIELEITTLTNLGSGLGRVKLPGDRRATTSAQPDKPADAEPGSPRPTSAERSEGGWVVMVPFTLPGERVRARVFRNQKNFSEADLVSVLTPSPARVDPLCPLYGRCGGCQYQHLAYTEQLAWKRRQVEELLRHMAGIEFPVAPVIGSPKEYGYRSKITPHFATPRDVTGRAEAGLGSATPAAPQPPFPIGFLRQGTRFDLIDVPRCDIATEAINARLPEVRAGIHAGVAEGKYVRGATVLLRDAGGKVTTNYDEIVTETVGDLKLRFLARDFFQNNPYILPAFTGYVRDQAAASGARNLVDAYCGSGLFALTCAPAFEKVAGIEISESSVVFARQNAELNGIKNTTFQAGDASAIFAGLLFPAADTAVVIDPPRKGCDESFLRQLFAYGPRAVVYVSCDPATQMRDLRFFTEAGYTLTAVQPFDLFPQTRHLECVITLTRATG